MKKIRFNKVLTATLVGAVCLSLLTGCSSGAKSAASRNYNDPMADTSMSVTESVMYESPAANYSKEDFGYYESGNYDIAYTTEEYARGNSSASAVTEAAASERKLIKRMYLTLETLEFDNAVSKLDAAVSSLGGYIESSESNGRNSAYYDMIGQTDIYRGNSNRYASFTVRIPSENLSRFRTLMGDNGVITWESLSTEDVTMEYIDTESRAKALRIQQERLLELLEKADTVDEIIALEDRISNVTYQLERQESVIRNYDNLVTFSTVTLSINEVSRYSEPVVEPVTFGERISQGLKDTFYDISKGLTDFSVGFITNLPYIIIWCVIIAVAVILTVKKVKKVIKKKHTAKEDEAVNTPVKAESEASADNSTKK